MSRRTAGSVLRLAPVLGAALTVSACLEDGSRRPLGSACTLDSECGPSLACRHGRCRAQCAFDRDCEPGQACVPSDELAAGVCTFGDEGQGGTGGCPDGLGRGLDGVCRLVCWNDDECEGGLACRTGLCQAPCNGPTALQDDFSTEERPRRTFLWADDDSADSVGVRDGVLVVEPAPDLSGTTTYGLGDFFAVDLRGSWVAVAVDETLDPEEPGLRAFMVLRSRHGADLGVVAEAGNLHVGRGDAGTPPTGRVVSASGPGRSWWRIREDGGVVSWDLRQGDGPWVQLWSEPVPGEVTRAVSVRLGVLSPAGVLAPGRVVFDDLNLDEHPRPPSPSCPSSSLSDGFDGLALGLAWNEAERTQGCVEVREGAAWLSDETGDQGCAFHSAHPYALEGDGVVARVGPLVGATGQSLVFGLWDGLDGGVWLALEGDSLKASSRGEGTFGEIPYTGQTYWRIRHDGDFVVGVSTDGVEWREMRSASAEVDPRSVAVLVEAKVLEPATPYEHRLDGINDGG